MFKPHLRLCTNCRLYRMVVVKAMLCQRCNEEKKRAAKSSRSPKAKTPIKKVSDKRQKLNAAYSVLRKAYMEQHPYCAANIKGSCTHLATDVHHLYWSKDREKYMNDFTQVMPVCRNCHTTIHSVMGKAEAVQRGFRKLDDTDYVKDEDVEQFMKDNNFDNKLKTFGYVEPT